MSVAVVALVVAAIAGVAIERTVAAGRMRAERDLARAEARGYRETAATIKLDMQRIQSAQAAALEMAEEAIMHGDPRSALSALARVSADAGRRYADTSTDAMLAEAASAAAADVAGRNGVPGGRGLLGRLARGGRRAVDGHRVAVDGASGIVPDERER